MLMDTPSPTSKKEVLKFFFRGKSEKAKIAWPKNAEPKMLREPACFSARWNIPRIGLKKNMST
jgi:hypothetical protein